MEKSTSGRLLIVSNRLPFQLIREGKQYKIKESDGGLVSALKSYFERSGQGSREFSETIWIGAADFDAAKWEKYAGRPADQQSFSVEPVFPEKRLYSKYYNGFCNSTLWPLFHYFPSFVEFDQTSFDAYETVNQLFADRINPLVRPGDVVWVHDYQLMLLPGLIREKHPDATIGFFLHIPFPSFEVFRLMHRPWKEKIVRGLLGADLVGFHTHEYVQHFLKTVQMVTGYETRFREIHVPDRKVKAEMFPLGIDFEKFNSAASQEKVDEVIRSVKEKFGPRKMIFSVDRLDYTKGITHRLSGFEHFLETNPEWIGNVVFVLVVVPSRQVVSRYTERKQLIEELIGRINGKYSTLEWQPVIYRYTNLSFEELSAMYNAADVGLITPLRDGMNLVAKEFIASKTDRGVLILSELAGAANEMSEAVLVNPVDRGEVAKAIAFALQMPPEVQKSKIEILQTRLRQYTVTHWMNDFLRQLDDIKTAQRSEQTRLAGPEMVAMLRAAYDGSSRRLILLDYDGTLVPFKSDPRGAAPSPAVLALVSSIAGHPGNEVAIVSGRDSQTLQRWLGHLPVILVSEHGAGIRLKGTEWNYLVQPDQAWKAMILPVLDIFTQRSPGSFVEEKKHTLVWHYRNVEGDLGFLRSRELLDNLFHLVRNSDLQIIDGNKVIEVRISGIDKGTVARKLIDRSSWDFVLAIGDDRTDEDMFRIIDNKGYSVKVGRENTAARLYVPSQRHVLPFLSSIVSLPEAVALEPWHGA